ncbi:MAG: hypothetical protein N3A71_01325 [Candidatus Dojkabacteria bacterium]|nr:hypothetical protein [Candidatus Dojkabacteria bacterium]
MKFYINNFLLNLGTLILITLFLRVGRLDDNAVYLFSILMGFVYYFLLYSIYNFNITPKAYFTVLLIPSIFVSAFVLLYNFLILDFQFLLEIIILSFFFLIMYLFVQVQKVINENYSSYVREYKSNLTFNAFLMILSHFLLSLALFNLPINNNILSFTISVLFSGTLHIVVLFLLHEKYRSMILALLVYFYFVICTSFLYIVGFINPEKIVFIIFGFTLLFKLLQDSIIYDGKMKLKRSAYIEILLHLSIITIIFVYSAF